MDQESQRRMLHFRAHHRGIKELDLFVGAFSDAHLGRMRPEELNEFARVLEVPDNTLLDWVLGRTPPPKDASQTLNALLAFEMPRVDSRT